MCKSRHSYALREGGQIKDRNWNIRIKRCQYIVTYLLNLIVIESFAFLFIYNNLRSKCLSIHSKNQTTTPFSLYLEKATTQKNTTPSVPSCTSFWLSRYTVSAMYLDIVCIYEKKGRTQCHRLPALCGVWGRVVFKPQALPTQMCRGWGSNPGPSGYRR